MIRKWTRLFRQARKQLGFTSVVVSTLAVAIGASTLVFSVMEGVLLRPLPFPDPQRLVAVKENVNLLKDRQADLPAPDVLRFAKETRGFASAGGFVGAQMEFSGRGEPVQLQATRMTAGLFPTLGVQPMLGRFFTQREDDGNELVTVLSYQFWKSRFGGDAHVLGQQVTLDQKICTVIGVMPQEFEFPLIAGKPYETQLWIPMSFTPDERADAGDNWQYEMVARLKPGVTRAEAAAEASQVAKSIQAEYPAKWNVTVNASLLGLKDEAVAEARPLVVLLFGAVMVVLLVACANVAGLLLIRALQRRREVAVLVALGAPLSVVVRQAIVESLVLSCVGAAIGLGLADVALHGWVGFLPDTLPRVQEIRMNWTVAGFAGMLAVGTGVLCGLAPAFAALRTTVNDALRQSGRTGQSASYARLRSALVVGEIAVAMVLLTAAGLLVKSFEKMRAVNPGFQPEHVVTGVYTLPSLRYRDQQQIDRFHRELLARLQSLPGVRTAGLSTSLPMAEPTSGRFFEAEGVPLVPGIPSPGEANGYVVGNFLQALQIPLLRGRYLTERDAGNAPPVVVVNRTLAERYWPGQNPIGKRMRWVPGSKIKRPWMTIVGEVADTKQGALDSRSMPQAYEPLVQFGAEFGQLASKMGLHGATMEFAVRTANDPRSLESGIRQAVHAMDRQLAVSHLQTMEQAISGTEKPRQFSTSVVSTFAFLAAGLAALGIYTVMAFSVTQRTHEIGVRVALGAQRSDVIGLVVSGGLWLGLLGCGLGLFGAVGAARLLSNLLFQVSSLDVSIYGLAVAGVLIIAFAASSLPALRAAAVNPLEALRVE